MGAYNKPSIVDTTWKKCGGRDQKRGFSMAKQANKLSEEHQEQLRANKYIQV